MFKYENKGYTISVSIPNSKYSVISTYIYDDTKEQFKVSLWLHWDTIDDQFKIDSQLIDSQYITSTKKSIKTDICKIIEQLYVTGKLKKYIDHYEYTYSCFDIGNSICETGDYNK